MRPSTRKSPSAPAGPSAPKGAVRRTLYAGIAGLSLAGTVAGCAPSAAEAPSANTGAAGSTAAAPSGGSTSLAGSGGSYKDGTYSADGNYTSPNGTETDPNKARAADMYRNQLAYFFLQRFAIKGKVPFEQLAKLRGAASVQVGADRTVTGFTITKPSGDATFDAEMKNALQSRVGATLPPPPPLYPDMLGASIPVSFSCTSKAGCE